MSPQPAAHDVELVVVDREQVVAEVPCDVLVVGVQPGEDRTPGLDPRSADLLGDVVAFIDVVDPETEPVHLVPPPAGLAARALALVRVPDDAPRLAGLAGAAASAMRGVSAFANVVLALPATTPQELEAVVRGALLGVHRQTGRLPVVGPVPTGRTVHVRHTVEESATGTAVERARIVADAVTGARDLVDRPPNLLTPRDFAAAAEVVGGAHGLTVEVWDARRVRGAGLGGLAGVGQGSGNPPRLVVVRHRPPRPRAHVALVGKGVTFDSGGLNLKPTSELASMKIDMAGAAAVFQACVAAARLELDVAVTAWLPLAENSVSGTSIRPGDVLTLRDGRRVEVRNTDLEGRLLLADALTLAREEKPDLIVDVATLTDAQVMALGTRISALMSNDDPLRALLLEAAAEADEGLWPMPLPIHLRRALASQVADIANEGERSATMLTAGIFLQEFASPASQRTRWAHLDICGTAYNHGAPYSVVPQGATGVPVQTLINFLRAVALDS
ncbi:leucyl aminopeptidase [Nocardioides thalensis]|uniref:Probable cytosol aminopeptidase n=1 Tax=Nocardioides thalensis TaxID=1914755 RepID=A0A853BXF1_9ACTN|nr:leucyl aminopeptidase [Nocardioides thalensis]NYI99640.1 leucyl aminopeptidase [Nocardioides thalensis]